MTSKRYSVSIVIPSFNGRKLLQKHLPAVIAAAPHAEIIVVDDAGSDDTEDYLKEQHPQVTLVKHAKNQRFAAACNSGVKAAHDDIVILLNNDVAPEKDFLAPLLDHFHDPTVFAVGCKELSVHDGKTKESGRSGGMWRRGFFIHWKHPHQETGETLWASGGSAAFRKSLWEKFGGMDVLFAPAYEEDRDLSYRAWKRGYRVLFEDESVVHHNHETSNKVWLGVTKMQAASYKNHLLFVWKNITDRNLLLQHLLWLPYHLIVTGVRSRGLFLVGFLWAITQLSEVLGRRIIERKEAVVSDGELVQKFQ